MKQFTAPTQCPECSSPTLREGEYLVCRNEDCPAQVYGAIKRWVEKIGVLHFGGFLIEALIENNLVSTPGDLYHVDPYIASNITYEGRNLGDVAIKAFRNLHAKKELDLHIIVGSLGIPLIGRSMAQTLVENGFDTIKKLTLAKASDLLPILGPVKAEAFVRGFASKSAILFNILSSVKIKEAAQGKFSGKSMCVTGFRDPAMEEAFSSQGGTIKSGVSKGLTYLVALDANGSSEKLKKARGYGTEVVSKDTMWGLIRS